MEPSTNPTKGTKSNISQKSRWMVIGLVVIVIAAVVAFLIYRHDHNKKTVVTSLSTTQSQSSQIAEQLSKPNGSQSALSLFNSQPASFQNSQPGMMELASIYISDKNYTSALNTYEALGNKYGWNPNLSIQTEQIAETASNTTAAIKYTQQAISELQQQLTTYQAQPLTATPATQ